MPGLKLALETEPKSLVLRIFNQEKHHENIEVEQV
jgi:hypothetical protein